jgi:hypothetical protein
MRQPEIHNKPILSQQWHFAPAQMNDQLSSQFTTKRLCVLVEHTPDDGNDRRILWLVGECECAPTVRAGFAKHFDR